MSRKANGEGSIYHRKDGRYGASAFVSLTNGTRKRIHVYAATRQEVHDRLAEKLALERKGIRTPEKEWTVAGYLDYWLSEVVATKNRPRTADLYESTVRVHIVPRIGRIRLTKLTVADVQRMLNDDLAAGASVRTVHKTRTVLRAALSRAEREELVLRNVAKLVEIPAWERKPITPWTPQEASWFLELASIHRWYAAYLMLLMYGMRRGEVLGLSWGSIDFGRGEFRVQQQLQRIGATLTLGPVKTTAGRRALPLIDAVREPLEAIYRQRFGEEPPARGADTVHDQELVFLSKTGTWVDPKNFVRTFHELREAAALPRITVHHTRHTAATMLKNLGVPARDAQLILGHAHVTTTQQLYQHGDVTGQYRALEQMGEQLITGGVAVKNCGKLYLSTGEGANFAPLTSGGTSGARTHDTLLKSVMCIVSAGHPTPVIRHLRARAYAQIVGCVAVKECCKTDADSSVDVADMLALLAGLRRMRPDVLRSLSFPFNLLPGFHPSTYDPPEYTPADAPAAPPEPNRRLS